MWRDGESEKAERDDWRQTATDVSELAGEKGCSSEEESEAVREIWKQGMLPCLGKELWLLDREVERKWGTGGWWLSWWSAGR